MPTFNDDVVLNTADGRQRVRLDIGPPDKDFLLDLPSKERIRIDGHKTYISLRDEDGKRSRLLLDGSASNIWLGGNGRDGDFVMFKETWPFAPFEDGQSEKATVHIDGSDANVWLGGNGANADIMLFTANAPNPRNHKEAAIWLSSENGDIRFGNGDCAEEFDVVEGVDADPGTVLIITEAGQLAPCEQPYDRRVAGVVAGAGGSRPGIVLGSIQSTARRLPVALLGRVFCKADASETPIEIGSLLTTGFTPGHAMCVTRPHEALGAVLGKALAPLERGMSLIPVLVALQ